MTMCYLLISAGMAVICVPSAVEERAASVKNELVFYSTFEPPKLPGPRISGPGRTGFWSIGNAGGMSQVYW